MPDVDAGGRKREERDEARDLVEGEGGEVGAGV